MGANGIGAGKPPRPRRTATDLLAAKLVTSTRCEAPSTCFGTRNAFWSAPVKGIESCVIESHAFGESSRATAEGGGTPQVTARYCASKARGMRSSRCRCNAHRAARPRYDGRTLCRRRTRSVWPWTACRSSSGLEERLPRPPATSSTWLRVIGARPLACGKSNRLRQHARTAGPRRLPRRNT